MKDFAKSDDPRVQAQLDRLAALSLPQGRFGLEAIRELLFRLGDPQQRMPPAFHVAGTNGKGSVCAFLRAIIEAEGLRVHVTTSPHLVRYNERIRIAGGLIGDDELADLLGEVLDAADGLAVSFFEATIAAAFLAFSRVRADACVIETGLGGRFDATRMIEHVAACGIATLGIDHEKFLLAPEEGTPDEPLARIAFEKAGIAKRGVPLVTMSYPPEATREIANAAQRVGAPLFMRGQEWSGGSDRGNVTYHDENFDFGLPSPTLPGAHQVDNALLAIAMLVHQKQVRISPRAILMGLRAARWPARMQLLGKGPLTMLAPGHAVWLDGGHNPDAGAALARQFEGERLHLVIGMLANKNPEAIVGPLQGQLESLRAVPVPGHECHPVRAFGAKARSAANVTKALKALPRDGLPVLIAGSLYLAGEVLRLNDEVPA